MTKGLKYAIFISLQAKTHASGERQIANGQISPQQGECMTKEWITQDWTTGQLNAVVKAIGEDESKALVAAFE